MRTRPQPAPPRPRRGCAALSGSGPQTASTKSAPARYRTSKLYFRRLRVSASSADTEYCDCVKPDRVSWNVGALVDAPKGTSSPSRQTPADSEPRSDEAPRLSLGSVESTTPNPPTTRIGQLGRGERLPSSPKPNCHFGNTASARHPSGVGWHSAMSSALMMPRVTVAYALSDEPARMRRSSPRSAPAANPSPSG